jgi:hypothetical protein
MSKKITDTIAIHNLNSCSEQDLADISSLIVATQALIILNRRKYISSYVAAWIIHTVGISSGLLAIKNAHDANTKFLALLYIPLILYCAHQGSEANNKSRAAKTELQEYKDKYQSLKKVIQQVKPSEIHDIAKIYRTEVPQEDDITPESVQKAIQYILIKYQR